MCRSALPGGSPASGVTRSRRAALCGPNRRGSAGHGDAGRLAGALTDGLGAHGTFVAVDNVVSQSVPHLHVHVVPRSKGDGLRGFFWPRTKYAEGEMAAYAAQIRAALDR